MDDDIEKVFFILYPCTILTLLISICTHYTIPRMIIYYAIFILGMKTGSGRFAWENAILGLIKLVLLFFIVPLI